jgi:glycosyltransferase involved in cell wall biosynthesis
LIANRRIGVVIPAFNEERLLPKTLAGLPSFVDAVVVVDDASTDDTRGVAREAARHRDIALEVHNENQGVGGAIVSGYKWCLDNDIDIAVVMGADNQMDPENMGVLLLPLLQGTADYVVGNRLAWPSGWRAFPPVRLFGVVTLAAMTRWATGIKGIRDAQSGYTAITNEALRSIDLENIYTRYGFPNDMLSKVAQRNLRVCTRPVRPIYADEESGIKVSKVVGPLLSLTLKNLVARHREDLSYSRPSEVSQTDREIRPRRQQA